MDSDAALNPKDNEALPVVNTPRLTFDFYGSSVDVYALEESSDTTCNQSMQIFYYTPIMFWELDETNKKFIWSNEKSVRINVELQRKELNDLVRDHLKRHFQADNETASLWIVTPRKIKSLEAFVVKIMDSSKVNGINSFRCSCPHFPSMVFHFECLNGEAGDIVKSIEDVEYAIDVVLVYSDFNQDREPSFTHRIKAFNASPGMFGDFVFFQF
jgi:hypothetical protein